ncbi:uncharacterized protein [Cicer arietinum]|uniref:Uncharacterized protein LOC101495988 n=1 Tax=Cicer arietinum TaxID=3827 RepID=A0A1S2Y384_CICAR|nr:uncharacterized protein LOC101495988 [Cicer arietinum]
MCVPFPHNKTSEREESKHRHIHFVSPSLSLYTFQDTMAATVKQMSLIVSAFGVASFFFGVIAENKKPAAGTPVRGNDGVSVTCNYPSDPTVALGCLSVIFLIASTVVGYLSLFYPYKGKVVPQGVLLKHTSFTAFFNIALFTAGLAAMFLLWPIITEQIHLTSNVHLDVNYECPTAKTGLLGGGAFLSLDSSLFWLVALMLADNAREDYFEEQEEGNKGESNSDVGVM